MVFFALLTLCEGNPPVTGEFASQKASNGDICYTFIISLNNRSKKTLDWPVIQDTMAVISRRSDENTRWQNGTSCRIIFDENTDTGPLFTKR